MAGASIEITVHDADIRKLLEQLQAKLGDLTPVFRDLGEALTLSHRERFARAVAPDGTPWPALSPRYRASKKKNQDKLLVLDGWLRQLHYQAAPDALRIGTDRLYGATHQFGDPSRHLPARPFLGLDEAERAHVMEVLLEWLAD
ncbi:MAG: phage virion morphogenesis protein [Candidatus Contendobacter sp.]